MKRTPYIALVIGVAITVMATLFGALAVVRPFSIPTGSMEDTLMVGDRLFVQLFPRPVPRRRDIVVFRSPSDRQAINIKRVAGIGGDRIKIIQKQLYVNGVAVQESYVSHRTDYVDSYRDNFPAEPNIVLADGAVDMLQNHVLDGEVTVPKDGFFVLGDNRDLSYDSRYFGFVARGDLFGRPLLIYGSKRLDRVLKTF